MGRRATSRIENYLGFPFGVSGDALTAQASLQVPENWRELLH